MLLEVTYTYEDYAEANAAHVAAAGGLTARRKYLGCAGWALFVALAILLFMMLSRRGPVPVAPNVSLPSGAVRVRAAPAPAPAPPRPLSLVRILLPVVPWLLIFGLIWFVVFRLRAAQAKPQSSLFAPGSGRPDPRDHPAGAATGRTVLARLFGVMAFAAAIVLLVLNTAAPEVEPMKGLREGPLGFLLPVAPWFLIVIALLAVVRRGGIGVRRLWDGQPHLQRPKRIEVGDEGVVVSDALSRIEHRWPSFTHARESRTLFLIYVSNYGFHMVPKRGFATNPEADEFRELARRMIVDRPGPAFPVLPAAPASPSPSQPL